MCDRQGCPGLVHRAAKESINGSSVSRRIEGRNLSPGTDSNGLSKYSIAQQN